jgi:hypothetical protein
MLEISLIVVANLIVFPFLAGLIWVKASPGTPTAWLVKPFVLYIGFAFVIKSAYFSLAGWESRVTAGLVVALPSLSESIEIQLVSFIYSCVALLAVLLAIVLVPMSKAFRMQTDTLFSHPSYLWKWTSLLWTLIGIRLSSALAFGWGSPGVEATFTIPLVTGFVNLLSRDGLMVVFFVITAARVLYGPHIFRNKFQYPSLLVAFAMSDLLLGWKSALVFSIIGLAAVLVSDARARGRGYGALVAFSAISLIVLPSLYIFASVYRYIRLDPTLGFFAAVGETLRYIEAGAGMLEEMDASPIESIFLRITGVEGLAAAVTLPGFHITTEDLLLKTDIVRRYTTAITGDSEGVFSIGGTLIGTVSMLCGDSLLCILGSVFAMTFVTSLLLLLALWTMRRSPPVMLGSALALGIVFIHMQLATGAILAFYERIFVMFLAGTLLIFLYRRGRVKSVTSREYTHG